MRHLEALPEIAPCHFSLRKTHDRWASHDKSLWHLKARQTRPWQIWVIKLSGGVGGNFQNSVEPLLNVECNVVSWWGKLLQRIFSIFGLICAPWGCCSSSKRKMPIPFSAPSPTNLKRMAWN